MIKSWRPEIQFSHIWNCSSCERKIMIASPFTKPSITVCGISLTSLPSPRTQNKICSIPMRIRVAKRYSTQKSLTNDTITIARAPVAPEIIPGLPQKIAVISPTINAACKPIIGLISATKENAIASGTSARATVNPESTSVLI